MNIVFPLCGKGERFKQADYAMPKPLISIWGKPMIRRLIESLTITKNDRLFFVYTKELEWFGFADLLRFWFPEYDMLFVVLDEDTSGPAETLYKVLEHIENKTDRVISIDCDTFYQSNVLNMYKESGYENCIFYFEDVYHVPLYSYINLDSEGLITQIAEKRKISNNANVGIYCFRDVSTYEKFYEDQHHSISEVFAKMLGRNERVNAIEIDDFCCVGTPFQLQYTSHFSDFRNGVAPRVCFDLDNTLVSYPAKAGDYITVKPIMQNINMLKFLKRQGCTIIIYTARRMKTHSGNIGKIVADIGQITLGTLRLFGIPYDEIYFGKPFADVYIDDLAFNPYANDIEKQLGFYNVDKGTRFFNSITYSHNVVVKTTKSPGTLEGEVFWYQNIPDEVKTLFPKFIRASSDELVIERIYGITFSYLYVMEELEIDELRCLLYSLSDIHRIKPRANDIILMDLFANYVSKLSARCEGIPYLSQMYEVVLQQLKEYEQKDLAECKMIHGDPVFSNVLLDRNREIKLIDMRGKLGDEITMLGDRFYDYAKIYQSLIGYDHIMQEKSFNLDYMKSFIDAFEFYITARFGKERMYWIKVITNSLLLSLYPLHEDTPEKQNAYLSLIKL